MTRIAVLQSNYIPWKGYFDIIHDVDIFVFYDDVQYTKNDWRNRNRIKTPQGVQWLTIPVGSHLDQRICDVRIPDPGWATKHWRTLEQNYGKAPHFRACAEVLRPLYHESEWPLLSDLNQTLIRTIARDLLGINTEFRDSREFEVQGSRQERLMHLLDQLGAEQYISGPAARNYIKPEDFADAGIELLYKDYTGYPEYPQFYPPFEHGVTALDLLFQAGLHAAQSIWGWRTISG